MQLKNLLKGLAAVDKDMRVTGLALDSRTVMSGNVFIALDGAKQHGLMHTEQAVKKGACGIIFDPAGGGAQLAEQINDVALVAVEGLGLKLGEIAARFYNYPSRTMDVIGITGTNGKTSCSQFLSQLLDDCGVIGTLGWGDRGKLHNTLNTTPDALTIQKILAELLNNKKTAVAMEVSSHGLEQGRVNGIVFKGAVFTNISRDHLDYHQSMDAYVQAKLTFLEKPGLAFAVVNLDDAYSRQISAAVPESVVIWGVSVKGKTSAAGESVNAANIVHQIDGIEFDIRWREYAQRVKVPLYGDFNSENVLTVLTVMLAMGISFKDAVNRLTHIKAVTGRMERLFGEQEPLIFIDYAHTPDALDKVLSSLRKHSNEDLWVVFGCGGNRDTGKRAQMGKIAERWADHVIVTDDNPRFENGLDIVREILTGCSSDKVEVIQNREQAIQQVISKAAEHDCIVIAGKGHEQYQEINGVRLPFSDKRIALEALKMRAANR
ncbi:UDP-N-acetylmuramoyl-L-alanyl-D-glutamate--2, 6-diaminopimelate ligase [Candidatus Methylobacter favarea]|uniref:UDP-N-acetylmuramoyl-L-alanyl-D-glutamate--2,6-diaminopimelate ligase n=1 Tax=Candidatus Methylobacter favarea TaxID=2707345 RepID=A0A8S0W9K5_9GAMM|nr:UDP-N-acetylmuramoyl-L-alanyl-D-glutamate--2,6-diaminopimelate ligase [Candidatus Methylobacter favarea]CAA9890036.1 UDP-N-acetylmuramoyl-L-alanyl-D-glutamate--2, 6-diaminopimelate ligase [Candidatus Methylobacter favarea]